MPGWCASAVEGAGTYNPFKWCFWREWRIWKRLFPPDLWGPYGPWSKILDRLAPIIKVVVDGPRHRAEGRRQDRRTRLRSVLRRLPLTTPSVVPAPAGSRLYMTPGHRGGVMEQARGTTVVAGGTLIDGTGAAPVADGAVVVTDGRIAFAGPEAAMPPVPADAERIDARGGTIMPGLVEAHFHADVLQRRGARRPRHQVPGGDTSRCWPRSTRGWRSSAATRRPAAAAACSTSTSG